MHQPGPIENGPCHHHAVDELRALDVQLLQDHASYAQAHKMRPPNAQVIDDRENVLRNDVKIVFGKFRQDVLAVSMVPEVDQQQPVMGLEGVDLVLPSPYASARSVHKHQPRRLNTSLCDHFVIQQRAAIGAFKNGSGFFHRSNEGRKGWRCFVNPSDVHPQPHASARSGAPRPERRDACGVPTNAPGHPGTPFPTTRWATGNAPPI